MKRERQRKLNAAQHAWLAIITELALERMGGGQFKRVLCWELMMEHRKKAGGKWNRRNIALLVKY